MTDADDREAKRFRSMGLRGQPADDRDRGLVGRGKHMLAVEDEVPRIDRQRRRTATRIAWMVARPMTGTSKRMSWFGFATLTTQTPGPAR